MSSKTVKITNGKIVNYTISADGYKTINGSKLITNDDTININMIPSTDTNGVYSLGDRIGGCASFVCYFNSTDPDTGLNKTYAVFVLDAKYRGGANWGVGSSSTRFPTKGSPSYTTSAAAIAAKESATWQNNLLLENARLSNISPTCINMCRQNFIFVNGEKIQGQLPNAYELLQIFGSDNTTSLQHRKFLDSKDPTVADYPNNSLETWSIWAPYRSYGAWSCTINNTEGSGAWNLGSNSTWKYHGQRVEDMIWNSTAQVIPIFEIPVN